MGRMVVSRVDRHTVKMVMASLSRRATITTADRNQLGMGTSHPTRRRVPMVARVKEETVMDSKAHMVARDKVVAVVVVVVAAAAAAMEDGVKVKVVVRVEGLDVTKATAQKEGATEGEAVVAAAMTVALTTAVVDMTAVVDTTVAEEEDLLVWEVVTVVATKITVDLETTAQGMNQMVSRTTLTTTPFLSRDWEKKPQYRKLETTSSKLVSSR